jgi:fructosamine-3-kinase
MTWIIDPIESNKMLRFNYMMKENDNKWTKFKKKRWLCWLVKRKKNYEAQFQDNQMLNDEIEEKWQKKTSTIKPSYHGKLTSHNSGCEVELTS